MKQNTITNFSFRDKKDCAYIVHTQLIDRLISLTIGKQLPTTFNTEIIDENRHEILGMIRAMGNTLLFDAFVSRVVFLDYLVKVVKQIIVQVEGDTHIQNYVPTIHKIPRPKIPKTELERAWEVNGCIGEVVSFMVCKDVHHVDEFETTDIVDKRKDKIIAIIRAMNDIQFFPAFVSKIVVLEYLTKIVKQTIVRVDEDIEKQNEVLKP